MAETTATQTAPATTEKKSKKTKDEVLTLCKDGLKEILAANNALPVHKYRQKVKALLEELESL